VPGSDVTLGDGSLTFCTDGTGTYLYDDVTGVRSEGSAAALRQVMRLFDALPEVDYAWPSISARDLHPLTAGLEIEAISFDCFSRHVQDEVRDPAHVAPLLEMFEAVAGGSLWDRPVFSIVDCTVAPLQHEREMTEAAMLLVRAGVPVLVLPMPLTGTTSPITVLGTCIVNLAELLSAVVLFQLVQPGCPLISGVGAAVADMRTGGYLCGAPEVGLINLICIEMSHFYGLPVTGTAGTGDAKASNFQAGVEAMLTGLACGLAGADSMLAFGLIDGAETVSLAKAVLDRDVVTGIKRFLRDDSVDVTTALTDDIRRVGVGGHFLAERSTRSLMRGGELWTPRVFQRAPFESYRGRSLVQDAADEARELLRTHEVPPLPDDVAAEIDAVIGRYARSVGAPEQRVPWRGAC
jgi:trimethylamine--corrinoid protein Co-methyltransferase